jgi:Lon protease-like protein
MAEPSTDTADGAQFHDRQERVMEIPIFPLNTVLYPEGRLPLRIFEVRYVDMTKACIRDDSVFGVCQILDGREAGVPAIPAMIGCTARIAEWEVPSAGLFSLITRGERAFRIHEHWVAEAGLIRARVELEPPLIDAPLPASAAPLARFLSELIERSGAAHFLEPHRLDDTAWVCHRFAEILPLPPEQKLALLGCRDPLDKLTLIERAIAEMAA